MLFPVTNLRGFELPAHQKNAAQFPHALSDYIKIEWSFFIRLFCAQYSLGNLKILLVSGDYMFRLTTVNSANLVLWFEVFSWVFIAAKPVIKDGTSQKPYWQILALSYTLRPQSLVDFFSLLWTILFGKAVIFRQSNSNCIKTYVKPLTNPLILYQTVLLCTFTTGSNKKIIG